jgi:starch synthase
LNIIHKEDGMRLLFVSSEVYPFAKTGGLADVSEALPRALANLGADVRILMPAYGCALRRASRPQPIADLSGILGVQGARLLSTRLPGSDIPVWLADAPELFHRDGLYQNSEGQDWPDNARRFAFLSHVAARIGEGTLEPRWQPEVIHANDWHTGLVPLLVSAQAKTHPPCVFTMHNLAFQGLFPAEDVAGLDLPEGSFTPDGAEYFGKISFLKAGIRFADKLTTVSPTYAREILTNDYGFGLDGLLRARASDLTGILNGADYGIWDPAHDAFLSTHYDFSGLNGKKHCKAALQRELGLTPNPDLPLLAFISRMTEQKMADVLLELMPTLAQQNLQLCVLSDGDHELEQRFRQVAHGHTGTFAVRIGYQEPLAHRMQAGADMLLAPARFEPCGLTQIYALRYGTVPVVRATGGLADTVVDTSRASISDGSATGFVFAEPSVAGLREAILRAVAIYREPLAWRRLQLNDMKQDFSWQRSANTYLSLYQSLTAPAREAASEASVAGNPKSELAIEQALA